MVVAMVVTSFMTFRLDDSKMLLLSAAKLA
jgi:hypothetical protein